MPPLSYKGRWQHEVLTEGLKNAVSIELTAFLAFFVFCEQAVPSYSKVRKKTKLRNFLNSLQCVENNKSRNY